MTSALAETAVLQACQTLFGLEPSICRGFLFTLQPSGAKSAYRKKAKETHPDLFHDQDRAAQQRQANLFHEILGANETLNRFLKEWEKDCGARQRIQQKGRSGLLRIKNELRVRRKKTGLIITSVRSRSASSISAGISITPA